jgi:hypothetical protein
MVCQNNFFSKNSDAVGTILDLEGKETSKSGQQRQISD